MSFDREKVKAKLHQLAKQGIYIGTSSWTFEEWRGTLYLGEYRGARKDYSEKQFKADCLNEYATVFPTVCYDGAYYNFPTRDQLDRFAEQTPSGFKMAMKCPRDITVYHYPNHTEFGKKKGQFNADFLNVDLFKEKFYDSIVPAMGNKLGPIIFEFSPFHYDKGHHRQFPPIEFVKALHKFLEAIPRDIQYAVEVRDRVLVSDEFTRYVDCLRYDRVAHCMNEQTWMPPIAHQFWIADTIPISYLVARLVTPSGVTHEEAKKQFGTFDSVRMVRNDLRTYLAKFIRKALEEERTLYLYTDNKIEGFSPGTVAGIIDTFEMLYGPIEE